MKLPEGLKDVQGGKTVFSCLLPFLQPLRYSTPNKVEPSPLDVDGLAQRHKALLDLRDRGWYLSLHDEPGGYLPV